MSATVFRIIVLGLAATFAWSALAKVMRAAEWRAALGAYRLPRSVSAAARHGVPLTEILVSAALASGAVRLGAAASLALLAAFSIAVLRARSLQGDKLPCGCFGKTKKRDYRLSLVRNAALAALASLLLVRGEDVSPLRGFAAPSGSEVIALVLVVAGVFFIGWMLRSAARIGRMDAEQVGSEGVRK